MTSRERILLTLKHKEPDRVPIDLGGMRSSGIHAIAYNKLKRYLNCEDKSVKIFDLGQQLAVVDDEIRKRVTSDVVELKRLDGGFGTRINSWKQIDLFLDGGDAGDEYTYSPPLNDEIIVSRLDNISIQDVGPSEAILKVSGKMILPVGLKSDRKSRAEKMIECSIESEVKLFSEVQRIEFKIKFDNRVCDHRLQVGFPTTIKIDQVYAEGHFDVVK